MANENASSDIATIIRDLKKRRADLDASIASLERAYGATAGTGEEGATPLSGSDQQLTELPRGAFLGKSLPAAVKLYLSAMKRKQTDREIATALHDGGVESTSDNFEKVVTGCLNRMKVNGEVLRFKDGWGLTEFYPAHLRTSLSQDGASKRKTPKKKGKKTTPKPKPAATVIQPRPVTGLVDRLEAYVRERKGEWVTFHQVVAAFSASDRKMLALNLGKLAKKHKWEKSPEGHYRTTASSV